VLDILCSGVGSTYELRLEQYDKHVMAARYGLRPFNGHINFCYCLEVFCRMTSVSVVEGHVSVCSAVQ